MLLLILLPLAALAFAFWYYERQRHFWTEKGISGPPARFLWGNLNEINKYDRPRMLVLRDWSKEYGKLYGIQEGQRKFLVVSDLAMVEEMLTKKFDHFQARSKFVFQSAKQGPKTHIIEAWGSHWKRLRALGSPAFSNNSLKRVLPTVQASAQQIIELLERHDSADAVNIFDFYQEYTMAIICKLALGQKNVEIFDNEYLKVAREALGRPFDRFIFTVPSLFPFLSSPLRKVFDLLARIFKPPFFRLMDRLREDIRERKKIRESGAMTSSNDFIDMFLDAEVKESELVYEEDENGASRSISRQLAFDEVVGQCFIFMIAGFDTTSISLAYTTRLLALHPEVQERLRDEIEAVCTDDEISYDQLAQLKYADCVIKETLRHFPLASFAVNRECTKSTTLGGVPIDKGTFIYTDTWSMHMDEAVWGKDSKEFRPERWVDGSMTAPRVAFQAFGEGPRMCLGMRLAYMEEKMALAVLLRRFVVEECEETKTPKLVGSFVVGPERLMVRLRKRE